MSILSCDAAFVLENLRKDLDALVLKPGTRLSKNEFDCDFFNH